MAQLVVRNLDDEVKTRLRERAARHGHSMEEEVRSILRIAVQQPDSPSAGLGTRIARRFAAVRLAEGELEPPPWAPPRPARFGA